jgi:hypothetical protein
MTPTRAPASYGFHDCKDHQFEMWGRPSVCGGLSGRLPLDHQGGPGDRRRPRACPTFQTEEVSRILDAYAKAILTPDS